MKQLFVILLACLFIVSCNSTNNKTAQITNNVKDTTAQIVIKDSLVYLSEQIKNNGSNIKNWINRADYFLSMGKINDALIDMQNAVKIDSTNIDARTKYAAILLTKLDIEKAMENYKYVLSVDSSNIKSYVGIGKIYALIDNPGMATGYLKKAYQINPHYSEAYFLEGLIYRDDFYKTGREESWKIALSSFQTAVEQDPDYYAAYIEMGVMNDERQNPLALEYYNSALAVQPNSTEAWYNKGMFYQTRQKLDEAKECYKKIIKIDSFDFRPFYNQGYIKWKYDKDYDSAVYFFKKTIKIDSLNYRAYNNLGLSYEDRGDVELAKNAYRKAIEINPDFKLAKKNLHLLK